MLGPAARRATPCRILGAWRPCQTTRLHRSWTSWRHDAMMAGMV